MLVSLERSLEQEAQVVTLGMVAPEELTRVLVLVAQVEVLAAMGVDEVQGYLLARPMSPALVMQVFEAAAITACPVRV